MCPIRGNSLLSVEFDLIPVFGNHRIHTKPFRESPGKRVGDRSLPVGHEHPFRSVFYFTEPPCKLLAVCVCREPVNVRDFRPDLVKRAEDSYLFLSLAYLSAECVRRLIADEEKTPLPRLRSFGELSLISQSAANLSNLPIATESPFLARTHSISHWVS